MRTKRVHALRQLFIAEAISVGIKYGSLTVFKYMSMFKYDVIYIQVNYQHFYDEII